MNRTSGIGFPTARSAGVAPNRLKRAPQDSTIIDAAIVCCSMSYSYTPSLLNTHTVSQVGLAEIAPLVERVPLVQRADLRILAINDLGDPNHASPAIAGGRMY